MTPEKTISDFLHTTPKDIEEALMSNKAAFAKWETLTPLARNEWICWVTFVKKQETRDEHMTRMCEDLQKGKRRPCCWPGCPHRKPDAMKYFGKR